MSRALVIGRCAGLAMAFGCRGGLDCEVTVDQTVGTVATVTWSSADPGASSVAYGLGEARDMSTPTLEGAREHTHTLYGLPGDAEVGFLASLESNGRTQTCEGSFRTDAIPDGIPRYDATVDQTDSEDAPFLAIANAGNDRAQPVVVNRAGQVVWWSERAEDVVVTQFDITSDGLWLLEQDLHREDPELSALVRLDWIGGVEERIGVEGAHHRFVALEDGTIATLAVDIRTWTDPITGEVLEVVGDQVIEVDPEGVQQVVFSTWDVLEPDGEGRGSFYGDRVDWTHANSIWIDAANDTYLITLGHLDMLLEVERETGTVLRRIDQGTHALADGSAPISFPHDGKWTEDDTLLLMTTDVYSFGVEYQVDSQAGTLTEVQRIGDEAEVYAAAMGEIQTLDGGGHLLCFGMGGLIQERDGSGDVRWELWGRPGHDRLGSVRPFRSF